MKYLQVIALAVFVLLISCDSSVQQISYADSAHIANTEIDTTRTKYEFKTAESWSIASFSDEFGDSGKDKYIHTNVRGTFSNSAVSDEYLNVTLLLTQRNAGLFLREYNDNRPAAKFIGSGKIRMKNESDQDITIYSYSEWNQEGGLAISGENFKKLKSFLLKSIGTVKIVVYDEYSSSYNFSIDIGNLQSIYSEIKNPKSAN